MAENETLEFRVQKLEEDSRRNQETHREFYSKIESVNRENAVMASDIASIKTLCAEIKNDVKALTEKPAKKWDNIVASVLQWAVLGILAYSISTFAR